MDSDNDKCDKCDIHHAREQQDYSNKVMIFLYGRIGQRPQGVAPFQRKEKPCTTTEGEMGTTRGR